MMSEKLKINLGNVQKTLLLPLWARATETRKKKPLLVDKAAVEIIDRIDFDFSVIASNISEISLLGWIGRSLLFEKIIKNFIKKHPKATIVNIGCGLDTTFERIDNGTIEWFDLDLPDVIEMRKLFIGESARRKFIAQSFLNDEWLNLLKNKADILFMAAGVLYYFEEREIRAFLGRLVDIFPKCEIAFDATSQIGMKMANKMVITNSGMDEKSFLKWGLKSSKDLLQWDDRIQTMNEFSLFENVKNGLPLKTRIGILLSDMLKMQYMVHLKTAQL
jgi:O-methyltransferase involved in polyketide biosynthesis